MINQIKYTDSLKDYVTRQCEENKIFVSMADDILPDNYMVIKIDNYYNSLNLGNTPPSVDCLVVLKCHDNDFIIYLVELKNVRSPGSFNFRQLGHWSGW